MNKNVGGVRCDSNLEYWLVILKSLEMMAQISIGAHQGNLLGQFMRNVLDVDSHGHATIHSGHFMVSCVHEDVEDTDGPQATVKEEEEAEARGRNEGYNFENASRETSDSYQFGSRSTNQLSIDASLATLFEHMTLAYSGKITSPKWKNFKGIKVKLKDKIRLNNIIWREWHMQYIKRQRPIICQFEAPISERTHSKPEAVVLEGKYWKRRLECLTTEYKKWRLFFKDRFSRLRKDSDRIEELESDLRSGDYDRLGNQFAPDKIFEEQMLIEDDDYFRNLMNFSNDTLFSSLNPPFAFPDPREISQLGFASDIIQPHLIQLQPSLDESMDTLGPLPAVLNDFRDFGRNGNEKNGTRGLFDMILGDTDFTYEINQSQAQRMTADLREESPTTAALATATDNFRINQLKQQLMDSTPVAMAPDSMASDASLSDLFVVGNESKLTNDSSDVAMSRMRDDEFFSSGLCNGTVADRRDQLQQQQMLERRASEQLFQQPAFRVVSLGTGLYPTTLNGEQTLMSPQHEFIQNAGGGVAQYSSDIDAAVYQLLPQGTQPYQTVSLGQNSVPSRGKTPVALPMQWHCQLPVASPVSTVSANYGSGTVPAGTAQPPMTAGKMAPASTITQGAVVKPAGAASKFLCLHNKGDAAGSGHGAGRRGSTGSLQAGKGKKHVTFLCPQPMPAATNSKTKQRPLAPAPSHPSVPAPAFCSAAAATKVPVGPTESPKCGAVASSFEREQQHQPGTILAQLLTQGKLSGPSFPQTVGGGRSSSSAFSSTAPPAAKQHLSAGVSMPSPSYFAIPSVNPVVSMVTTNQLQQPSHISKPPSFSDFHRDLLSAAVSQALGVEKQDVREVTAAIFNNSLSSVAFHAPSPIVANSLPSSGSLTTGRSRNPSNESDEGSRRPDNQREHRRVHHLSAEQKRRSNIKNGFEALNQMVPELSHMSSAKINKATTLQKAAECCRQMKQEVRLMSCEQDALRRQIDDLQAEISSCQAQLPATGVPVVRPQTNQSKVLFEDYIRHRTLSNWKFWIFSFLIRPLFDAYDDGVLTTSVEVFRQSLFTWLQHNCSLVSLRPGVLHALRDLCTSTSILENPSHVPQEATKAVTSSRSTSGSSSFVP